jgi:hypothetical protein
MPNAQGSMPNAQRRQLILQVEHSALIEHCALSIAHWAFIR